MFTIVSGSNSEYHISEDTPVGVLTFLESGAIDIKISEEETIPLEVVEAFNLTSNFIFYALTRSEWVSEFAETFYGQTEEPDKPNLFVIQGGASGSISN